MLLLREKIKEAGLKATPQRLAIYESMRKLGHASVDMVIEDLKNSFPTLTVATIYNVLESFVNTGLLTRRFSSNNKMYFDVNVYEHAHFYDQEENSYMDFHDPELVRLVMDYLSTKQIEKFDVKTVDIQLVEKKTDNQ
jgi:Fur family peroxide stress response transcriptional regulator